MSMNFTTVGKSYGDPKTSGMSGLGNQTQQSSSQNATRNLLNPNERRQGNDGGYQNIPQSNKSDSGLQAFPHFNLKINRVDSKQYKERQERTKQYGGVNQTLTHSLIAKPYTRDRGAESKLTSTSVDKNTGNYYLKPAQNTNPFPSNQSDTNRGYSNRYNYATYRKQGNNMSPRYGNERDSDNASNQNQAPSYNRRIQQLDIGVNMVSSVISRESDGKGGDQRNRLNTKPLSASSRGRLEPENEAYQLYNSRHPNDSIRRSTIQISKAISSNAITELERQNQNQSKKIKKLENQLQDFKNNLQKWDDTKHRFQLDIQSKSRQVFDLQRDKKRLHEQLQSLRAYRTMQTVEQVIIVRLKQQIMQLNKKIIDMQAQHYKNQKMLLQKLHKDGNNKPNPAQVDNEKEKIQKLQLNTQKDKKQIELLGVQLQKQKQKSWKLQREKQQYLAQKVMEKQDYQKDAQMAKKDIANLRQQIQKHLDSLRNRDSMIEQMKNNYSSEIQKLTEKNKSNEAEINKIKVELTQQVQIKQKQATERKLQEQKKITQKQMQEQLNKKLQEQKRNFDNILSNELREKEAIYTKQINQQKKTLEINFANQLKEKQTVLLKQLDQQKRVYEGTSTKQIKDKQAFFNRQLEDQKKNLQVNFANQIREKQTQFARQLDEQKRNLQTQLAKQIKEKQLLFARQTQQQKKNLQIKQLKERQILFNKQIQEQRKIFDARFTKELKDKEILFNKQLQDQRKAFDAEMNGKMAQKQQEYKIRLNEQMRLYQAKIVDQGKNQKVKQNQQRQMLENLRIQKQKSEGLLRQKIVEFQQNLKVVNEKLVKKQQELKKLQTSNRGIQQVTQKYQTQIRALKNKIDQSQNAIRQAKTQSQMAKSAVKQRQAQVDRLKKQNIKFVQTSKKQIQEKQKWKQQQVTKVQQMIRVRIETQYKQRERDFQIKKSALQQDLVQTKAKLQRQQQQMTKVVAQSQKLKQTQQKAKLAEGASKQFETKYNNTITELNTLKNQNIKLQQRCKQAEIDLGRATENVNIWKIKVQNLEKSKVDWQSIQQERDQLKVKIREVEQIKNNRNQLINKYEQLLAEHQVVKQKLKLKEQENIGKQTTYYKIKQHYQSSESKISALNKQVVVLSNKVQETDSKYRNLLSKVEMEEYKNKQLYDKMVAESQVFIAFMKKLQEENEAIFQKYLKVRKLCRNNHIKIDDTETSQKADYSTFRQYLQKQVVSQFSKMIMPKFQAKVFQKLSQLDSNLTYKYKKLVQIKNLVQIYKRRKLTAKK